MITDTQIAEISAELEKGKRCYLHLNTGEIVSVYNKSDEELSEEDIAANSKVQKDIDNYKEILPPSSTLVFKMMESFTAGVNDFEKQSELMETLSFEQPFANFRTKVFRLNLEKEWHAFRSAEFEIIVKKQL